MGLSSTSGRGGEDVSPETTSSQPKLSIAHLAMLRMLDQLHYRRIVSSEDLAKIGHLRHRAFDARDIYTQKFGASVIEPIDERDETFLFGVFRGEKLLSTVRLNWVRSDQRDVPAVVMFGDFLNPLLDQGQTFIDPSRLAVDPDAMGQFPGLPILTLRLAVLATRHFQADQCLSVIKDRHEAFYRRIFFSTRLAGPISPPEVMIDVLLMGAALTSWDRIKGRNPVFWYLEKELGRLFDASGRQSVLPTASLALGFPKRLPQESAA